MMATLKPATQVHNYDDSIDNVMSCGGEREREKEGERENEMMQKSLIIKCIIIL
jgi:hypothetical protein